MNEEVKVDVNDLAVWFPPLERAGLPVPKTRIVTTELELFNALDGKPIQGYKDFLKELRTEARKLGEYPIFMRTGHVSGKHSWSETCFVQASHQIAPHVARLLEESACAGIFGLPTNTWVLREMLPTRPLFRCRAYRDFPVAREYRIFCDGEKGVLHWQPYWPEEAVERGRPDRDDWRELLHNMWSIHESELDVLLSLAGSAVAAQGGGFWSVDFLQTERGWVLIDMADGDRSFRWEP